MVVTINHFGHKTIWVYADTKEPVGITKRRCPKCGELERDDGQDPCIADLPGITGACCGHGTEEPYILLNDKDQTYLRGELALEWIRNHQVRR